jgi:hypothetical protein
VPTPIGPSVTLSARVICALYRGSLRSSATKSNTSSIDRSMAPRQLRIALAYHGEFTAEIDEAIAANRRTSEIETEYPFLEVMTRTD